MGLKMAAPTSLTKIWKQPHLKSKMKLAQLYTLASKAGVPIVVDGIRCLKKKVVNQFTHRLNSMLICGECHKEFDKRCNLKDHLRIHSGVKPFKCMDCGKAFRQRAQLSKHQKRHEVPKIISEESLLLEDRDDHMSDTYEEGVPEPPLDKSNQFSIKPFSPEEDIKSSLKQADLAISEAPERHTSSSLLEECVRQIIVSIK
jgi:hypothetical protein